MLVLEDAEKARERGANILAYVRGYGATSDAYHLTAPDKEGAGAAEAMRIALADAGLDPRGHRVRQRARHLDPAQRPRRDAGHQGRARRRGQGHPRVLHQVGDRAPARRRRRGGGRGDHPRAARPDRPPDPRATRRPRKAWTWTTSRARPAPWTSTASPRSASRTPSASAATTRCCAWRPHDDRVRSPGRGEALADRAPGGALRPGLADAAALRRPLAPDGREGPRRRRRDRRRRARRRPPGVLLRAGPVLPRRLARRAARRLDRARAAARRPRGRAGRRLHRVRRRAHAGGPRGARRLRAHLQGARRAVGQDPADLGDLRRVGRRRLLLAGADRLRRDDRARRTCSSPARPS